MLFSKGLVATEEWRMGLRKAAFRKTKQEAGCLSSLSREHDGNSLVSHAGSQVPHSKGDGAGGSSKELLHLPGKEVEKSTDDLSTGSGCWPHYPSLHPFPLSRELEILNDIFLPSQMWDFSFNLPNQGNPSEVTLGHLHLKNSSASCPCQENDMTRQGLWFKERVKDKDKKRCNC